MEMLVQITKDEITQGFLSIVWYGLKYFKIINANVLKVSPKIFKIQDQNPQCNAPSVIIEIHLCTPIFNTSKAIQTNKLSEINCAQSFEKQCLECSFEN